MGAHVLATNNLYSRQASERVTIHIDRKTFASVIQYPGVIGINLNDSLSSLAGKKINAKPYGSFFLL